MTVEARVHLGEETSRRLKSSLVGLLPSMSECPSHPQTQAQNWVLSLSSQPYISPTHQSNGTPILTILPCSIGETPFPAHVETEEWVELCPTKADPCAASLLLACVSSAFLSVSEHHSIEATSGLDEVTHSKRRACTKRVLHPCYFLPSFC